MIYSPSEDSYLLEEEVVKYSRGKKVLDVGSGSGIQAETALKNGANSVLAVDINLEAVKLLKVKGIRAVKSDLFSNVKTKFDLIVFNPPYLPEDEREDSESSLITSGGKKGDEIILRFLKSVKKYMNKDGIILIVISSLTLQKRILKILKEKKLIRKIVAMKKVFMEELQIWKIENK